METIGGIGLLIISGILFILFILWIALPFLIVGTNNRLNRLIALMHENNSFQEDIRADLKKLVEETEEKLRVN